MPSKKKMHLVARVEFEYIPSVGDDGLPNVREEMVYLKSAIKNFADDGWVKFIAFEIEDPAETELS